MYCGKFWNKQASCPLFDSWTTLPYCLCATLINLFSIFHFALNGLFLDMGNFITCQNAHPHSSMFPPRNQKSTYWTRRPVTWPNDQSPCYDSWSHLWENLKKRKLSTKAWLAINTRTLLSTRNMKKWYSRTFLVERAVVENPTVIENTEYQDPAEFFTNRMQLRLTMGLRYWLAAGLHLPIDFQLYGKMKVNHTEHMELHYISIKYHYSQSLVKVHIDLFTFI